MIIEDLPLEIYLYIFDFCSISNIINFGQVSKYHRKIVYSIISFLVKTRKKNAELWKDYNFNSNIVINYKNFINTMYQDAKEFILNNYDINTSSS